MCNFHATGRRFALHNKCGIVFAGWTWVVERACSLRAKEFKLQLAVLPSKVITLCINYSAPLPCSILCCLIFPLIIITCTLCTGETGNGSMEECAEGRHAEIEHGASGE